MEEVKRTAIEERGVNIKPREEILSIPKKVFDYVVSRIKYDGYFIEKSGDVDLNKLSELSIIRSGVVAGSIGYKRNETLSTLFLWPHPSYETNYKMEIICGFFYRYDANIEAIYEKINISFPPQGLTILSQDEINIISLVLEGLRHVIPYPDVFRRVK